MTSTRPSELNDGVLTSWLALTTPGPSPPSGCADNIFIDLIQSFLRFDNFNGHEINQGLSCYPKEVYQWWSQPTTIESSTTLLGPFECPNGFTTASLSSGGQTVSTLVGCCPSSYTFSRWLSAPTPGQCVSPLTSGQVLTVKTLMDSSNLAVTTTTVTKEPRFVLAVQVNGYIFPAASTTTSFSASSSGSGSTSNSVSITSLITSSTNPAASRSSSEAPSDDPGLSTGAKAGIGVGITLAVISIICLVVALILLRRRKAKIAELGPGDGSRTQYQKANVPEYQEMQGDSMGLYQEAPEGRPKQVTLMGGVHEIYTPERNGAR